MKLQTLNLVCPACNGTGFQQTIKSFADLLGLPEYEECFCSNGVFRYLVELDTNSIKKENK